MFPETPTEAVPVAGPMVTGPVVTVAGIGVDGWPGLSPRSKAAIEEARVIVGGARQLALLPDAVAARRIPLPSGGPLTAAKLEAARDFGVHVIVVQRPPLPPGSVSVPTVVEALRWIPGS